MRYIMWSGGWDSTYLLCKQARESDETIQPVYINYRHGNDVNERKFRAKLLDMIRAKTDIKAAIQAPLEIQEEALPTTPEYETAYEQCRSALEELYGENNLFRFFGKAALLFPSPEIGMEAPPPGLWGNDLGRFGRMLRDHGMTVSDDGTVNTDNSDPGFAMVVGCFKYPILFINEIQMLADVKEWGYFDDVFQNTWSCYSNMDRQCGVCRSCEVKWLSGDAFRWRFDEKAPRDHDIKLFLQQLDEENGTRYADYFTHYIINGNWVTVNTDDSSRSSITTYNVGTDEYKQTQEKSERLMQYFSYLENNWPEGKTLNAPII